MTGYIPAPEVLPLPAPAPLLLALLQLTFVLHLLAMNLLLGGLALALVERLARRSPGDVHDRLLAPVAKLLPTLFAATVTLGVAPLLFMQALYGGLFYTSSIIMGRSWFLTVPLLMLAYYGAYLNSFRGERLGGVRPAVIALAALILAWVGFLFSNNTSLMLTPERWADLYLAAPGGASLNLDEPVLWPRWLHMMLGALAVAGAGTALLARRFGDDRELAVHAATRGAGLCLGATLLNTGAGIWYLLALPETTMKAFMGGRPEATGLLGVGLALTLALLWLAFRLRSRARERSVTPLVAVLLLQMVVMVQMRHVAREVRLDGVFDAGAAPVATQTGNLVLFAVLLLAGAAGVVAMVRLLLTSR